MSYHQFLITLPDQVREIMVDRLMALGSLGVIEGDGSMTAYFPAASSPGSIVRELEISQELLSQAGHRPGWFAGRRPTFSPNGRSRTWKRWKSSQTSFWASSTISSTFPR